MPASRSSSSHPGHFWTALVLILCLHAGLARARHYQNGMIKPPYWIPQTTSTEPHQWSSTNPWPSHTVPQQLKHFLEALRNSLREEEARDGFLEGEYDDEYGKRGGAPSSFGVGGGGGEGFVMQKVRLRKRDEIGSPRLPL